MDKSTNNVLNTSLINMDKYELTSQSSSNNVYRILKEYCKRFSLKNINCEKLSKKIGRGLVDNMDQNEVLGYIADASIAKSSQHPDYKKLASVIVVDVLKSKTDENFKSVVTKLYNNIDRNGDRSQLISTELYNIVQEFGDRIQQELKFERDYYFDYFGIKTLERSYLYKLRYVRNNDADNKVIKYDKVVERPQHLIMRVALGIHGTNNNLQDAFETYNLMSERYMVHATPTLFNAGSVIPQMSSCFLLNMQDSIDGIFDTVKDVAKISKWAGGVGISLSDVRAKGSLIRKTNGASDGIIPLCALLGMEGKYVNQGGKRMGAFAVYLEPWHADIYEFCELRKNTKSEDDKARDLFLALWVCDLFMKRVNEGGMWSLMCPDECPGLTETHGENFEALYTSYEKSGKYKRQVKAVELWYHILTSQIETGMPYMLFKDHANNKSNQKNLGTIKCSNLCSEIIEYTDDKNSAVCNLASVCLPRFVMKHDSKSFDFKKLIEVTKVLVKNLDIIIDKNYYPTEKTRYSNMQHRPIGIGVQGLADVYNLLGLPFDSVEARNLNKQIFETIYFAAVTASNELAIKLGSYKSFEGSPASKGELQYHMWNLKDKESNYLTMGYDWNSLIASVKKNGLRNSLLTTCMPTVSTAQIMGNSESVEPYLTNIFERSTIAGGFIVINENLVNDLIKENIWSDVIRKKIIIYNGSIQNIKEIPDNIKKIYKTAFEIKLKDIITQSYERGPFIDQSQSLNLFMEKSNFDILTSAHFYSWENGLKTGLYYLRSRPSVDPIQYGIDVSEMQSVKLAAKVDNIHEKISNAQITEIKNTKLIFSNNSINLNNSTIRKEVKVIECTACT